MNLKIIAVSGLVLFTQASFAGEHGPAIDRCIPVMESKLRSCVADLKVALKGMKSDDEAAGEKVGKEYGECLGISWVNFETCVGLPEIDLKTEKTGKK